MPEQPQIIVKPNTVVEKQFGTRKDINIKNAFPSSPIYLEEVNDEERREAFNDLVVDGLVLNGNGINSFSRDYKGAPNILDVETGGAGKPASPFVPNLASPGPGSVNPADQPEFNGELPDASTQTTSFGTGLGGTANPAETSEQIRNIASLGEYISGRSYQGSDGSA